MTVIPSNDIKLYQSTDGGESWPDVYTFNPQDVTFLHIDAYADANGVHIVWDNESQTQVYYVRFNQINTQFGDLQVVNSLQSAQGKVPKVIAMSDQVQVSFVKSDESPAPGASRDFHLGPSPSWDNFYRETGVLTLSAAQQSAWKLSDEFHMVLVEQPGVSLEEYRATSRTVDENWASLTQLDSYGGSSEYANWRRAMTDENDTLYFVYHKSASVGIPRGILIRTYSTTGGWSSTPVVVESYDGGGAPPWRYPTISRSTVGLYTYWQALGENNTFLKRRVLPIQGSLTENMFFTGNNWISGDTYIQTGKTVWLKPNSETNILANNQLVVQNGATLIVEANATVNMESGAGIVVEEGGTVRFDDAASLVIPVDGYLQADAGSEFLFGNDASLEVQGYLNIYGTSELPVVLDRVSPSEGRWGGIVVDNSGSAYTSQISYATIAHCKIGVSTRSDAKVNISDCTIDVVDIGVEIVPGSGGDQSTPSQMIIMSNALSNISLAGISVEGFSTLLVQGNTITQKSVGAAEEAMGVFFDNASPQMLQNHIEDFHAGLVCVNASSPTLENELLGGFNVIRNCGYGVQSNYSDPVLGLVYGGPVGDDGGQNSIYGSSEYDLEIVNISTVIAENNWWGTKEDPVDQFLVDQHSYLDYDPWLDSDPNADGPGGNSGRQASADLQLLKQILAERGAGHYREAMILLKSLIEDEEQEALVKEWAIRQMIAIAQLRNQTGLSQYLQNLMNTSSSLTRQIRSILPGVYATERSTSNMLVAYNTNIREYPRTHLERSGLYGKLVHAIYTAKDYGTASQLFIQLAAGYPRSAEVVVGRVQLESFQSRLRAATAGNRSNGTLAKPGEGTSLATIAPTTYRLSESYPNPFNPSTTLSFDLPEPAIVSLVVYDVLGRKVAELAEGSFGAGTHTAVWNAEQQSSGVYFARFDARNGVGQVKLARVTKLVLTK